MKICCFFIAIFLVIQIAPVNAQNIEYDTVNKELNLRAFVNGAMVHHNLVNKKPEYPGGKTAWHNFLRSNINIAVPFTNKALPGRYEVLIRFIVGADGKVTSAGAKTNRGYGLEAEVIRCINKSGTWSPAETKDGQKVAVTLRTMVIFNVERNNVTVSFP